MKMGRLSSCWCVLTCDDGSNRPMRRLLTDEQITSLRGQDLEQRYPSSVLDRQTRAYYLPIAPSRAHPDNGIQLSLAPICLNGLRKSSYVNTRIKREAHYTVLKSYNFFTGTQYVLSEQSYRELVDYCGFQLSIEPTQSTAPSSDSESPDHVDGNDRAVAVEPTTQPRTISHEENQANRNQRNLLQWRGTGSGPQARNALGSGETTDAIMRHYQRYGMLPMHRFLPDDLYGNPMLPTRSPAYYYLKTWRHWIHQVVVLFLSRLSASSLAKLVRSLGWIWVQGAKSGGNVVGAVRKWTTGTVSS